MPDLFHAMRSSRALGLIALAIAIASGCSPQSASSSPGATGSQAPGASAPTLGPLTLYNGQHRSTTDAFVADFTKRTGIEVNVRSGGGSGLTNQIIEEGASSPADLVYTENSPALMGLEEAGLLAKVAPSTLAQIPAQYNSPNGYWVGVDGRATVLAYNPSLIDQSQLPHSILDLADPVWQGKIGIAPTESDFQPVITAVVKQNGEAAAVQWLEGLKRNGQTFNGNTAILNAVDSGQISAGIINNYYWFRKSEEVGQANMHSALYYFGHQDPGALVNISPAGILASSKQQEAAQRFLAYMVSPEGQQILVTSKDFEYPLAPGVAPDPGLKPFADLEAPPIGIADLGNGRAAVELLQQAGLL